MAVNPHTGEKMGISVKSRCRNKGKEQTHVRIPVDNLDKIDAACAAFGCVPYFAIVIEAHELIRAFILSKKHLLELFPPAKTQVGWKMTQNHLNQYYSDPGIMMFELQAKTLQWWKL